jgi:hypothetical protein
MGNTLAACGEKRDNSGKESADREEGCVVFSETNGALPAESMIVLEEQPVTVPSPIITKRKRQKRDKIDRAKAQSPFGGTPRSSASS